MVYTKLFQTFHKFDLINPSILFTNFVNERSHGKHVLPNYNKVKLIKNAKPKQIKQSVSNQYSTHQFTMAIVKTPGKVLAVCNKFNRKPRVLFASDIRVYGSRTG